MLLEDYNVAAKLAEKCVGLDNKDIEKLLKNHISDKIALLDFSDLENRHYIFQYISQLNSLFLNYRLNYSSYLLGPVVEQRATWARKVLTSILTGLRNETNILEIETAETAETVEKEVDFKAISIFKFLKMKYFA